MNKQTKNIITRDWVEQELRFYNRAGFRFGLLTGGLITLLSAFACVFPGWFFFHLATSIWVKAAVGLFFGGTFLYAFFGVAVKHIVDRVLEKRLLDQGAFGVVVRRVQYKTEKAEYRVRALRIRLHRIRLKEMLVFEEFGEVEVDHTEYQLAEAGDEYYIVVYYTPKPKMRMWYSCKTHEYRET